MPKVQLLYPEKARQLAEDFEISLLVIKQGEEQVLLNGQHCQATLEGEEIELNGYRFDFQDIPESLAVEVQSLHGGLGVFFNSVCKAFIYSAGKANPSLPDSKHTPVLEYLSLSGDSLWEEVGKYPMLKRLDIHNNESLTNLQPLVNLTTLTEINLNNYGFLPDLTPLVNLTNLTKINLSWCTFLTDLTPLGNLVNLTQLNLSRWRSLTDLIPLGNLVNLTQLNLSWCRSLTDLTPLGNLVNLTQLNLSWCTFLTDLTPLGNLVNLTQLNLSWCESITSLTPLSSLSNLIYLDISNREKLTSIRFVLSLPQLQFLNCEGCPNIHDFEDLEQLPNLRELKWGRTGDVHYVLMGSACRRADAAFIEEQLEDWVGTVRMAQDKMKYGLRLLETCTVPGVNAGAYLPDIGQALREAARIPGQVPGAFWSRYVQTAQANAAESLSACLDAVVSELDYDRELQEILYPLLLQLAEIEPVPDWLREWVDRILEPAATRPERARAVAPAAAVCWASFGDAGRLRFWEKKGTDPEQRDRVAAALACFYAKKGRFDKAKEYLDRISSRAVRDRTSAYIATQRAGSNMGAALDLLFEIQDESMRFDTAKEVSRYPEATQNPQHAFRLLLVLEQQAEVLADFLEQWAEPTPAPEGETSTQPVPLAPTPGLSDRDFFLIASSPWLCQAIGQADLEMLRDEYLPKTAAARSELYERLAKMLVHNGLLESKKEGYFVKALIATTKDE